MNEKNPFAVTAPESEVGVQMATSRAAAETQAAIVVAKKFPRDQEAAVQRILAACKRRTLAEQASYVYPRGDTKVVGPSIRLAEAIAQAWGNLDFGVVELEQRNGESTMMSYCWDLESNTRQTKVFTVPHERHTKSGNYALHDPRDIYEVTANQAARRLRACILGIIPGNVLDAAVEACERTLATAGKTETLEDRVRKMVGAFAEAGVSKPMIEKKLGHMIECVTEQELAALRKMFTGLRDGIGKVDDYFDRDPAPTVAPSERPAATNSFSMTLPPPPGDGITIVPGTAKPDHAPSIHTEFQQLLDENGITFDTLQRWGESTGNIENATSKASIEEIDGRVLVRLLKAKRGLISGLKQAQEGAQ